eukprot:3752794-Amphidinium_carterae.1
MHADTEDGPTRHTAQTDARDVEGDGHGFLEALEAKIDGCSGPQLAEVAAWLQNFGVTLAEIVRAGSTEGKRPKNSRVWGNDCRVIYTIAILAQVA